MSVPHLEERLSALLALVLEIADRNYAARVQPSDAADALDAVAVGLNLVAESLELEHERRTRAESLLHDEVRAYEEAPAMFCSVEADTLAIVKCNETMARTLGIDKDMLLQRRLLGFLPLHERAVAERSLNAIAHGETPEQTTFLLRGEGDRLVPVLVSGSRLDEGSSFRLVLRDVTREQMLSARLHRAQKLEVVGQLASGVSHDFNNLLQVIVGAATLLDDSLSANHPGRRELDAILAAADHGSGLTRQLLVLGKPLPNREAPRNDLNAVVRECRPLLLRTLGPSNQLVMHVGEEELPVRVEAGELTQVLINLVINGRDAMPADGVLTIRTRVVGDAADCFVLEVADNGVGIPDDLVDHVFEPFFTTKSASGGTGLGLAVCRRIAQGWGGGLSLRSELGVGTTVEVRVPADGRVNLPDEQAVDRNDQARRRIVVVDDEPMVRTLLARTVKAPGRAVWSADGMSTALEQVEEVGQVDLLITDVAMPGGSGVELALRLWQDRPQLPVIFVSGYTGDAVEPAILERQHVRFLAKPYRPKQLVALIEELWGDA